MSFIKYESVSVNDRNIKWRGNFTYIVYGTVHTHSHYQITSWFDENLKFLRQDFNQEGEFIEEQAAP